MVILYMTNRPRCRFQALSYCFQEKKEFDVKVSFARRPVSRLIKPGDITKEC